MAKIITVASAKGGTGKTTTTINIAAALSKKGYKILVIDTDGQGDTTLMLTGKNWSDPSFKNKGLYNMLKGWDEDKELSIPVAKYISPTNIKNCDIIATNPSTKGIPTLLENLAENCETAGLYEIFAYRLYQIDIEYDFILIDTRPSKDETLVKSALVACDYLLIPCTYNDLSIRGMVTTLTLCKELEKDQECEINILGIIMTMVQDRTNVTKLIKEEMDNSTYAEYLFKTEIHRGQAVENSVYVNSPLVICDPSSKQAKEYMTLCDEMLERMSNLEKGDE